MNDIVPLIYEDSRFSMFWNLCNRVTVVVDLTDLSEALDLLLQEVRRRKNE